MDCTANEHARGNGISIHVPDKHSDTAQNMEMTETPLGLAAYDGPPPAFRPESRSSTTKKRVRRERMYSRTTVVELVSTNATSSAFPESFGLSVSTTGRWIAACSTSALYLLSAQHLPDFGETCRAFRIRRKPLAVAITDNGRFAVLSTSHKIDVYQCGEDQGDILRGTCKKLETVYLDNDAKSLAFSRCGEVVAAGSDVGIEIKNLGHGAMERDKRQITCTSADRLMFSKDGRSLLSTSSAKKSRYSTFISVNEAFENAFMDEDLVEQQPLGRVWITQLLFPERLSARQAVLLPSSNDDMINTEILAFDSHADGFRIFDATMKRFTNRVLGLPAHRDWSRHDKPEECLPAISSDGMSVAVAIRTRTDKEVWVYSVPSEWWEPEATSSPDSESSTDVINSLIPKQNIQLPAREEGAPPESITAMQWLESNEAYDRLVALVSTVNMAMPEDMVPIEAPAASGKVLLFDFVEEDSQAVHNEGETTTVILDLSEVPLSEGLSDETLDLEREVDIVRRRTQVQRNRPTPNMLPSPRGSLRRSMSSGSNSGGVPTMRDLSHSGSGRSTRRRRSFSSLSSANEDRDEIAPMDEPYSQTQPRSQFSLSRAATIAANAPANRTHLRSLPSRPLEYRRADGLREVPHESDADNWEPPPPMYSKEPDNVESHPVTSNSGTASSYSASNGQRSRSSPNATTNATRRRSFVPPIPPIPQRSRDPAPSNNPAPARSAMPHGPSISTGGSATLTRLGDFTAHTRPPHASNGSTSSTGSHVSNASSRPRSGILSNAPTSAPAVASALPHGLPPNMTPPSPIAGFIRGPSVESQQPRTPTGTLFDALHRRSGSGGTTGSGSDPRRVASADVLRNMTPPPAIPHGSPRGSQERLSQETASPASGRSHRPALSRLATITSVGSHPQPAEAITPLTAPPQVGRPQAAGPHPLYTTPVTPTQGASGGRTRWWRSGSSNTPTRRNPPSRGTPTHQQHRPARPESRIMQYAPRGPQYSATAPPDIGAPKPGRKEKDRDGGMKCVVM